MAYIALYRKWRPKTFEDVVGQRQITETLQKAIDTDKVAHAYLFSGPRHFVIVAHAHGFGDVPLHFTVHGMVEPRH